MGSKARHKADDTAHDTDHLVSIATELGEHPSYAAGETQGQPGFQDFVQTLRAWIIEHYDLPGSQAERIEKSHLLLHLMAGAPTLAGAISLLERFRKLVWGDRSIRMKRENDVVTIFCEQPLHKGVPGLLSDLWSLSFLLTEFEFLAGGPLEGVHGQVRQLACLPSATTRLLFDHPLIHGAAALALIFPARHLKRPVIAKAEDIDQFLGRVVPHSVGAEKSSRTLTMLVAGMAEAEIRQALPSSRHEDIAERLGLSPATLRRRLFREGSTFRDIKEHVLDELAKEWLRGGLSVEATATRLGYSDTFAFRRAFQRRQHCSPSTYKNSTRSGTA
ncbi:AraC family transcriptional regulator [Acidocella sp.]|uniref:helix-turn-helix transcriptional regulator n=1 Tax=Acidocella sp. TaxID=50710 RepID=UPI00260839D1|nr:AraC family transcriptional regulator [Acidocella sp.]